MIFCMVVGCGSQSASGKDLHFAQVPSVVTNQGGEVEKSSLDFCSKLANLTGKILAKDHVCSCNLSQEEQGKVGTK